MTITITRALAEIRLAEKKIEQRTGLLVAAYTTNAREKASKMELAAIEQANLQSIFDLIKRRDQLKYAVLVSNATTSVKIGSETITVAEAIDKKNTVRLKTVLLERLRKVYYDVASVTENRNAGYEVNADNLAQQKEKEGMCIEDYQALRDMYLKNNLLEIIPIPEVVELMSSLKDEVETFEAEVDFVLSESNTITTIEV